MEPCCSNTSMMLIGNTYVFRLENQRVLRFVTDGASDR